MQSSYLNLPFILFLHSSSAASETQVYWPQTRIISLGGGAEISNPQQLPAVTPAAAYQQGQMPQQQLILGQMPQYPQQEQQMGQMTQGQLHIGQLPQTGGWNPSNSAQPFGDGSVPLKGSEMGPYGENGKGQFPPSYNDAT